MAQSSGPIAQGTVAERQFTDVLWRDRFGDEPGVLGDMDGTAYALSLPSSTDLVGVGSNTQASLATVAGFVHKIPTATPEQITIPVASGSARTDVIALRYDPAFTGALGPVRLVRIAGSTSAIPSYDSSPPGVEELPLWAITRNPGQALNLATVVRMYPRIAPSLEVATGAALPTSSPLGTTLLQGTVEYRRQLVSGVPAWAPVPPGQTFTRYATNTASGTLSANSVVNLVTPMTLPASPFGLGVPYKITVNASVLCGIPSGLGGRLEVKIGSTVIGGNEFTQGGTTGATQTFKANEIASINDNLAKTITVTMTALAGTITLYPSYGRVYVEATPSTTF